MGVNKSKPTTPSTATTPATATAPVITPAQPPSSFVAHFSTMRRSNPLSSANGPPTHPSIFSTLWRPSASVSNPTDFIPLFTDCISTAASRTQEYLAFKDPEDKFRPTQEVLTQVFLMTYINQSLNLSMTESINCTAMTPEQHILLGADWVWNVLEKPTKNPRIQIAVQVLHLDDKEGAAEENLSSDACTESMQMAQKESSHRTTCERMVEFCASVGKDCYALFLFFGKKNDKENIYGVLSNNFQAAIGKCDKIDRNLVENFFKGTRYLHTPTGMLQAIITKKEGDPLTLLIKFS